MTDPAAGQYNRGWTRSGPLALFDQDPTYAQLNLEFEQLLENQEMCCGGGGKRCRPNGNENGVIPNLNVNVECPTDTPGEEGIYGYLEFTAHGTKTRNPAALRFDIRIATHRLFHYKDVTPDATNLNYKIPLSEVLDSDGFPRKVEFRFAITDTETLYIHQIIGDVNIDWWCDAMTDINKDHVRPRLVFVSGDCNVQNGVADPTYTVKMNATTDTGALYAPAADRVVRYELAHVNRRNNLTVLREFSTNDTWTVTFQELFGFPYTPELVNSPMHRANLRGRIRINGAEQFTTPYVPLEIDPGCGLTAPNPFNITMGDIVTESACNENPKTYTFDLDHITRNGLASTSDAFWVSQAPALALTITIIGDRNKVIKISPLVNITVMSRTVEHFDIFEHVNAGNSAMFYYTLKDLQSGYELSSTPAVLDRCDNVNPNNLNANDPDVVNHCDEENAKYYLIMIYGLTRNGKSREPHVDWHKELDEIKLTVTVKGNKPQPFVKEYASLPHDIEDGIKVFDSQLFDRDPADAGALPNISVTFKFEDLQSGYTFVRGPSESRDGQPFEPCDTESGTGVIDIPSDGEGVVDDSWDVLSGQAVLDLATKTHTVSAQAIHSAGQAGLDSLYWEFFAPDGTVVASGTPGPHSSVSIPQGNPDVMTVTATDPEGVSRSVTVALDRPPECQELALTGDDFDVDDANNPKNNIDITLEDADLRQYSITWDFRDIVAPRTDYDSFDVMFSFKSIHIDAATKQPLMEHFDMATVGPGLPTLNHDLTIGSFTNPYPLNHTIGPFTVTEDHAQVKPFIMIHDYGCNGDVQLVYLGGQNGNGVRNLHVNEHELYLSGDAVSYSCVSSPVEANISLQGSTVASGSGENVDVTFEAVSDSTGTVLASETMSGSATLGDTTWTVNRDQIGGEPVTVNITAVHQESGYKTTRSTAVHIDADCPPVIPVAPTASFQFTGGVNAPAGGAGISGTDGQLPGTFWLTVDGSASTAGDSPIATYTYELSHPSGVSSTTSTASAGDPFPHINMQDMTVSDFFNSSNYTQPWTCTLTVTDEDGLTSQETKDLLIEIPSPVAVLTAEWVRSFINGILLFHETRYDITGSIGETVSYEWTPYAPKDDDALWNDNLPKGTGDTLGDYEASIEHSVDRPNEPLTLTLTVHQTTTGETATASATVTCIDNPPSFTAYADSADATGTFIGISTTRDDQYLAVLNGDVGFKPTSNTGEFPRAYDLEQGNTISHYFSWDDPVTNPFTITGDPRYNLGTWNKGATANYVTDLLDSLSDISVNPKPVKKFPGAIEVFGTSNGLSGTHTVRIWAIDTADNGDTVTFDIDYDNPPSPFLWNMRTSGTVTDDPTRDSEPYTSNVNVVDNGTTWDIGFYNQRGFTLDPAEISTESIKWINNSTNPYAVTGDPAWDIDEADLSLEFPITGAPKATLENTSHDIRHEVRHVDGRMIFLVYTLNL